MSSFSEALERARLRNEAANEDGEAWLLVQDFYKQEAAKRRYLHELAHHVGSLVRGKADDIRPWDQKTERSIIDRKKLEEEQARRLKPLTDWDLRLRSKEGYVLCEKVTEETGRTIEIEGQTIGLPRLTGLLLSNYGDIYSYGTDVNPLYRSELGTDAWGNILPNIYAGESRIIGEVERIYAPRSDGSDVNEYDAKLRSISGTLTLEDLLAGLVDRYELDGAQFEPDRWSLHYSGRL